MTTETVCDKCNNNWLSAFENDDIRPIATPLIVGERVDIIKPDDQWKLAAWAYKMALLLEVAMPPKERSPEFYTAGERLQFHQTTLPNEHIRVFIANYKVRPASHACPSAPSHPDAARGWGQVPPPYHDDYCWLPGHAGHRYSWI